MIKNAHKLLKGIRRNPTKNISKINERLILFDEVVESINEWGFASAYLIRKMQEMVKDG